MTIRWRKTALVVGAAIAIGAWFASDDATRTAIANAVGGNPALTAAKAKPICASPVNPNVAAPIDCIPQHLANLPPDPGEAGKVAIDGIDTDKDGMRDDVQRYIVENWSHSPIAMKQSTTLARLYLRAVQYGGDLGKEETRKQFDAATTREAACAFRLETKETLERGNRRNLRLLVLNTRERLQRSNDFDMMFANTEMPAFQGTASEACGFDVEALAAKEGKRTIASQLIAEDLERTKREQEEERK